MRLICCIPFFFSSEGVLPSSGAHELEKVFTNSPTMGSSVSGRDKEAIPDESLLFDSANRSISPESAQYYML